MDLLPDIWRQDYWLPPGVTWRDMEQLADSERPLPQDLLIALPLALGFVALRCAFERFCAPPMARCLGVKNKVQVFAAPSPKLESFYTQQSRQPTQSEIVDLMSLCGKTQRQIETWFRLRRNQDRPCQTKKFAEAAWRFFFYFTAFIAGLACLFDRPWFWDRSECWRKYPVQVSNDIIIAEDGFNPSTSGLWAQHTSTAPLCYMLYRAADVLFSSSVGRDGILCEIHVRESDSEGKYRAAALDNIRKLMRFMSIKPMERAHYWYYMLELGFYGSLLLRISVDVKRKDFKEQVIHHLATIFLLSFSYCANYIRIGTLVMLLHDSSDILLESAKMFNYGAGWRRTCDTLFVVFAVVFLVTRLVIFPSKIIHTTLVLSMEVFEPFVGYYFFNVLLMVLQTLHIFWAGLILRMVYKFLKGKMEKDERSDEESEVEEDEDDKGGEDSVDQGGDYHWERSKDTLNSKLSMLTNSCVLNNLTNHRASVADRMRKAQ